MKEASEDVVLDPITVRLLDFVESHEGPSKVANRIGIKPAVFYNYQAGRNKQPAPDILQRMALNYPDFDPLYILTGQSIIDVKRSGSAPTLPPAAKNTVDEITFLRREVERLEKSNNFLQAVVAKQLGIDMEPPGSKSESTTDPTQSQLTFSFVGEPKAGRSMMRMNINDFRPMNRTWPYPTRRANSKQ